MWRDWRTPSSAAADRDIYRGSLPFQEFLFGPNAASAPTLTLPRVRGGKGGGDVPVNGYAQSGFLPSAPLSLGHFALGCQSPSAAPVGSMKIENEPAFGTSVTSRMTLAP